MSVATVAVQQATIRQYAKQLQLATVGGQFLSMAEEAFKEKQGHPSYLEALLGAEVEDRHQHAVARRIKDAHFPKVKTLEEFEFSDVPHLPAAQIRNLAEGGYLSRSEPIIFLGETGTGKTHLATGLAVAACRQRKRVRFSTAAEMVTELIEAKNQLELTRVRNLPQARYRANAARAGGPVSLRAGRGNAARYVSAHGGSGRQEVQSTDGFGGAVLFAHAVFPDQSHFSTFRLQSVSHRCAALYRRCGRAGDDRQHACGGVARYGARDDSGARDGGVRGTLRVPLCGAPDRRCQSFGARGAPVFLHRKQLSGGPHVHQLGAPEQPGAAMVRQGQLNLQEAYGTYASVSARCHANCSRWSACISNRCRRGFPKCIVCINARWTWKATSR